MSDLDLFIYIVAGAIILVALVNYLMWRKKIRDTRRELEADIEYLTYLLRQRLIDHSDPKKAEQRAALKEITRIAEEGGHYHE